MPLPNIKLNNGVSMPVLGHGTWAGGPREQKLAAISWFKSAIEVGYRHFDTAHDYGTEDVLGQAIKESGIPREEFFITTKLSPNFHHKVAQNFQISLDRLGFDYVDLYLIHWPQAVPEEDRILPNGWWETLEHPDIGETWAQMEEVLKSGKARAIGVSNFSVKTLTQLFQTAKVIPAVNQVEMHPHLNQNTLKEFCDAKGIVLTAYSPTGYAQVREDPIVDGIAKKHDVSAAQVSLAWHIQRGTTAIPKSTDVEHQKANLNYPKLDGADMEALGKLDKGVHLCYYPGPKEQVFGWTYEQLGW